jgi:hypothetical protein
MASRLVTLAGADRALRFGEMLLDRHALTGNQLGELGEVDVAPRYDADDRTF